MSLDHTAEVVHNGGVLSASGTLSFTTVPDLWRQSSSIMSQSNGPTTVDLRAVRHSDSAGLGLLVEWLRLATHAGRALAFINVPDQVRSLARVNGLSRALNLPDAG